MQGLGPGDTMQAMPQHLYIISGASRGMGLSMARQLLMPGHTLVCISRSDQPALAQPAQEAGAALFQWRHDLADSGPISVRLEEWLGDQTATGWATATLINNAGIITHIGPLSQTMPVDLAQALRVGLEAPMMLSAAFLRATQAWPGERKVLNISSGLGRKPMASQAAYCAAKAGMDHFSRCLALEEALKPSGAKVCSLAPGVIDTGMQHHLRSADPADFPDRAAFEQLKSGGHLMLPDEAASAVLAYLAGPGFGSQPVADIRS